MLKYFAGGIVIFICGFAAVKYFSAPANDPTYDKCLQSFDATTNVRLHYKGVVTRYACFEPANKNSLDCAEAVANIEKAEAEFTKVDLQLGCAEKFRNAAKRSID